MSIDIRIPALDQIANSLAQLVVIETNRAAQESKNMIAASDVLALINDFNAVTLADANDKASLATAQANLATAQQQIAEFNDPALATALSTALANAAAATPPANPVVALPVVPTPVPAPVITAPAPDPTTTPTPVVPPATTPQV